MGQKKSDENSDKKLSKNKIRQKIGQESAKKNKTNLDPL